MAGREDDGNGLLYYRNRYYSSTMKRFISENPIGLSGGINQYAYVGGNPLDFYDPYGLWAFGDSLPQGVVDAATGFGDGASFGATSLIRKEYGIDGGVNQNSGYYTGGELASLLGPTEIRLGYIGYLKYMKFDGAFEAYLSRNLAKSMFRGSPTVDIVLEWWHSAPTFAEFFEPKEEFQIMAGSRRANLDWTLGIIGSNLALTAFKIYHQEALCN